MVLSINRVHHIWAEKYRPINLDQFVGNDHFIESVKRWLNDKDIPHLLLYGPAGTGKTSIARIITDALKSSVLSINASDENGIEVIRTKLRNFSMGVSLQPGIKIAILDEADFITPQGQAALREMMERFSLNTRFILTANYKERIIDPIQSRCQTFEIIPQSRKDVAIHVAAILEQEATQFNNKDVATIVNAHYPDMRKIINDLQRHMVDGKLVISKQRSVESDYLQEVIDVLKGSGSSTTKLTKFRQIVANSRVRDFAPFYRKLFDSVDDIVPKQISMGILAIAEGQVNDARVVDHEINAVATLIQLLRCQE